MFLAAPAWCWAHTAPGVAGDGNSSATSSSSWGKRSCLIKIGLEVSFPCCALRGSARAGPYSSSHPAGGFLPGDEHQLVLQGIGRAPDKQCHILEASSWQVTKRLQNEKHRGWILQGPRAAPVVLLVLHHVRASSPRRPLSPDPSSIPPAQNELRQRTKNLGAKASRRRLTPCWLLSLLAGPTGMPWAGFSGLLRTTHPHHPPAWHLLSSTPLAKEE